MVAATAFFLPNLISCKQQQYPIGLQLYSLRDIIPTAPKEVLKKIAAFGYQELETYGYNDGTIFGLPF